MSADEGFIVTFYSYKGGVGRTMALANIAVLLAQKGLRTLAIDFDLEAPGLHRYFQQFGIAADDLNEGMLDILVAARDGKELDWQSRLVDIRVTARGRLSILTSGRHDDGYPQRVLDFNWRDFFEKADGGQHIEQLRDEWRAEFDVVLVDSRTGITDSGGVCTIQLPDVLVPMFTANDQSVQGCRDVAVAAQQARQNLAFDRPPLLVFPLPARFDSRAQYAESRTWLTTFADELGDFYNSWIPTSVSPRKVLERTKLPYVAYFSFGEKLPVVEEGTSDPEGLGYAFATAATLIAAKFQDVETILFGAPLTAEESARTDMADTAVEALTQGWMVQATRSADAHRQAMKRARRELQSAWVGAVVLVFMAYFLATTGAGGLAAAAIVTAGVALVTQYFRAGPAQIAAHKAAEAKWRAIRREIVDLKVQADSGAPDIGDAFNSLVVRMSELEANAPAVALGSAVTDQPPKATSAVASPEDDRSIKRS